MERKNPSLVYYCAVAWIALNFGEGPLLRKFFMDSPETKELETRVPERYRFAYREPHYHESTLLSTSETPENLETNTMPLE